MSGFDLLSERIPIQGTCHEVQTGTGSAAAATHRVIEFYGYSCHFRPPGCFYKCVTLTHYFSFPVIFLKPEAIFFLSALKAAFC